ncbi:XTP/dITP diphosphatase [Methanolobus halotolerans]|uniref:dITP/XTP pyrophosphatase n=1 Tax=Methanolobus halotolerans TaxID=2052935 RepID=A0A4E0Q8R3_9EURY|nr:XTP/dITP diphosphatase [Methanolobus halotolerans]TGC11364.1 non-canonical purine NTP pyrophosphatase, RdgB/HAM1 family [Methanolobus halotolerans]
MRKIVFVTGNKGKFGEAKEILAVKGIEVIQNRDGYPELQEDELEPIAAYGAKWAAEKLGMPVMVDDSGLFIKALKGFPGPYSAFVEEKLGNGRVLKLMEDEKDRTATFKSVIGYCEPGSEPKVFTGTVEGKISYEERGTGGFGYDPIFDYNGKTFGELGNEEKNKVSHRRRAIDNFFEWLD